MIFNCAVHLLLVSSGVVALRPDKSIDEASVEFRNDGKFVKAKKHEFHSSGPEFTLVQKSADKVEPYDGYTSFQFRSDIAPNYQKLLDAVHAKGGKITSAGSLRPLSAKVSAGRVPTSLHYTGAAFDMSIYAAANKPDKDPYVLVVDPVLGPRRWRVWFRSDSSSVPEMTLKAVKLYKDDGGATRARTVSITGRFFDFTALADDNGFTGINCWRSTWDYLALTSGTPPSGKGSYFGGEFWHFQCKTCIAKGDKFGDVLKTMYTEDEITEGFAKGSMKGRCKALGKTKDKACKALGVTEADKDAASSRWTKTKDKAFTGGGFR